MSLELRFVQAPQIVLRFANSARGYGVPSGGTADQVLTKIDGTDYNTEWTTIGGGSGISDGDYGDIIVSGSGTVLTIDSNVVSNAKLAQVATGTVKGRRTAATGNVEDITNAQLKSDLSLNNVDNTSDANKPVSTDTQAALNLKANINSPTLTGTPLTPTASQGTNTTQIASTAFVVAEIIASTIGLLDDRGNYSASSNLFPSSGGSGTAGVILKGDLWTVSVAGTLGGSAVSIGDTIRALTDTPGQTASNWALSETNISYVPENVANKATTFGVVNDTLYPTVKAVDDQLDLKLNITDSKRGIVEIDFGSSEIENVTTTVAATWVTSSIYPIVQPIALVTEDHDPDDYFLEKINCYVTNIIDGVSFDIITFCDYTTWGKYKIQYQGIGV